MNKLLQKITLFVSLTVTISVHSQSISFSQYINQLNNKDDIKKLSNNLSALSGQHLETSPDSVLYCAKLYLEQAKTPSEKVVGYSVAGISSMYIGDFENAKKYEQLYLKYALETKALKSIASAYNDLGMAFDYSGNYDSAVFYYKKSLIKRYELGDLDACQGSLSNIGLVLYLKGNLHESLTYLFEAYRIAEATNNETGIASAATNLSLVFLKLKNYDKALTYVEIAQKIFIKNDSKKDFALGLNNLGAIYLAKKEYQKALDYHLQSLDLRKNINDHLGIAMSYQNIGATYLNMGNFILAEKFLTEGKALADSLMEPVTQLEVNNGLMRLYYNTNKYEKAYPILNDALSIYNNGFEDYVNAHNMLQVAAKIFAAKNDFKNAYQYNTLAQSKKDSIENSENSNILAQKEAEFVYEKKKKEDEFKQAQQKIINDTELQKRETYNYMLMLGLLSMILVLFFVFKSNREKKRANLLLQNQNNQIKLQHQEISQQKQIIELKNKDITDSIQYAKRLQDAILPEEEELQKILGQHFILYQPKDIVSGDFYWVYELEKDDFLFAVIDCTGHGVPGGFVSIVAHNALERAIKEFKLKEPAKILNKVNELIVDNFKQNKGADIRDGMDIALCRKKGNELYFAGANNPLWLAQEKNGKIEITEVKADKQPIGYYENHIPFNEHKIIVKPNDIVYLFSDGYADQFGGPKGKKFKYSQLKELLIKHYTLPLTQQKSFLVEQINNWKGKLEQIDDICILGIQLT